MTRGPVLLGVALTLFLLHSCGEPEEPTALVAGDAATVVPSPAPPTEPTADTAQSLPTSAPMPATEGAETAFTAPEITLEDYLRLTAARSGKPLLVNFWATWCAPCVEEMPHLVELSEEYRDRLDFLAVSADSLTLTADQVPEMMRKLKMTLPTRVLVTDDQDAAITAIHAEWQGDLPATFFYNAQGELVNRLQGGQSREELQAAIQAVLSATP